MQNFVGQQIDRYRIIERLGMGGMAVVYKAYDTRLEREVAIKIIRTDEIPESQHERLMQRFEREAKAQARFSHPNIVPVHDYGEVNESPYLVMEYIRGGTLKERIHGPVDWRQAIYWLLPVADALQYAHERHIIHRDVKPSNILFGENDRPLLTDFGIAKLLEIDEATLTGTGLGVGTPEYMAPEQWQGKASPATDQYALGVVLYELLTGQKPYTADTPPMVAILQATEPLIAPSKIVNTIPLEVEKILYKALAKNPADRYQTMAGFRDALEGLLALNLPSTSEKPEVIAAPQHDEELHFEPAGEFERGMAQFKERLRESRASAEKPVPMHYRSASEPDSESETVDIVEPVNIDASTTHEPWAEAEHSTQKKAKKRLWWKVGGLIAGVAIVGVVGISLIFSPFGAKKDNNSISEENVTAQAEDTSTTFSRETTQDELATGERSEKPGPSMDLQNLATSTSTFAIQTDNDTVGLTPTRVSFGEGLYDEFDNPKYDGKFNNYLWQYWAPNHQGITQQDGKLIIEGNTYTNLIATFHTNAIFSEPYFYESDISFSEDSGFGSATLKLHIDLADGNYWVSEFGFLIPNSVIALTDVKGVPYYSREELSNPGNWYRFRMEIDPKLRRVSYYLDGEIFGLTNIPVDKPGRYNLVIGIGSDPSNQSVPPVIAYFDNVNFGPIQ